MPITNVALASAGSVATASSTISAASFSPSKVINGSRVAAGWGSTNGWNDANQDVYPDWLQIDFPGLKAIGEINVITLPDSTSSTTQPTLTDTFSVYGIRDYVVQYWDGAAWAAVPGGTVTNNNKVWRQFTFSAITTNKIRVYITLGSSGYSRLVEVEAWGDNPNPLTTTTTTISSTAIGGSLSGSAPIAELTASSTTETSSATGGSISATSQNLSTEASTSTGTITGGAISATSQILTSGATAQQNSVVVGGGITATSQNLSGSTSQVSQSATGGAIIAEAIPVANLSTQAVTQQSSAYSSGISAIPTTPAVLSSAALTQQQTIISGAITAYIDTGHHLGCSSIGTSLRSLIMALVPSSVEVIQGLSDAPPGDFVAFTSIGLKRLRTNEYHYQGENSVETQQGMQETFQIDFYGKCSQEQAIAFTTFFRSDFAFQRLKPVAAPLYCDEPRMIPLDSGERKYIKRWSIKAHIQINPTFTTPQDFFTSIGAVSAQPV